MNLIFCKVFNKKWNRDKKLIKRDIDANCMELYLKMADANEEY